MSTVNMSLNFSSLYTFIPNSFIDDYMPEANPAFSIVYIYLLRNCLNGNNNLSMEQIAYNINLLESDVLNALKYWENSKIIEFKNIDNELSIVFLDIPDKKQQVVKNETISISTPTKPIYSTEEIEIYQKESAEINDLFKFAEKKLATLLYYSDLSLIFSFYDWLRLPIEVIKELIDYCVSNGNRNMNYIEKVAIDWANNNINTVSKAQEYTNRFSNYSKILKACGITNRVAIESEMKAMDVWMSEHSMDLILEACDRTIESIGRYNLNYINKILDDWKLLDIKTLEQAKEEKDNFKKSNKNKKRPSSNKNKFVNYKGRTWDYKKLELLEQQYLENSVKGL